MNTLHCGRDDCPTLTLADDAERVDCPMLGCGRSISTQTRPDGDGKGTPITADDPATPFFDELTGEYRAEPKP